MGAGSIIGVLAGASLLPFVGKHTLKVMLGLILLLATVCLMLPELPVTKLTGREPTRPPAVSHDLQATSSDSSPPRRTT